MSLQIRISLTWLPMIRASLFVVVSAFGLALPVPGEITINTALPITRAVTVQPIRVQSSDGSQSATVFGGAESYSDWYIKEQINVILSQSGIIATWLPVVDYRDSFTLNGHPKNYQTTYRPQNDLYKIRSDAPSPPVHPDPLVLNMFFVEVVPGFNNIGEWTVAGIAVVDANGMVIFVGENLLTYYGGLDTIAAVVAHEIGHNLGLDHTDPGSDNLMAVYDGMSERLTPAQTSIIFTNNFGTDGIDFLAPYVPPTRYSIWAGEFELEGSPGDDEDGDKLANVIEFMLGLDPTRPDLHNMPTPAWDASGLTWTLPKLPEALEDGLTYAVEVSDDGSTWVAAGTTGSGSTVVTDGDDILTVRLDAGSSRSFMRLAIDLTPPLLPGFRSPGPREAIEDLFPTGPPRISGCSPHGCGHGGGHP